MLLDCSKKELEELGRIYGIKGAYKLKKAELVDVLNEMIPINMSNALVMLELEEIELFEQLMTKSRKINELEEEPIYYGLIDLGLVDIEGTHSGFKLSIGKRIKEAYKKLDTAQIKEEAKRNHAVRTHILGLLNLYGAAEIKWIQELYNRYHREPLTAEQIIDFMHHDRVLQVRGKVIDDYAAEETVYSIDEENFYEFVEMTKNKPYYVPSKEYIELSSKETYFDNTLQVQKLKSYLKKNLIQDESLIEEAITAVAMISRVDCDSTGGTISLMLEEWSNMGIEIQNFAQANEIIRHITAVVNTTRKWINRGHTSQELSPSTIPNMKGAKVKKLDPERNALCPCGSGKKYKKCCGKPK